MLVAWLTRRKPRDGVGFEVEAVRHAGVNVGMCNMHTRIALVDDIAYAFRTRSNRSDCHVDTSPGVAVNEPGRYLHVAQPYCDDMSTQALLKN